MTQYLESGSTASRANGFNAPPASHERPRRHQIAYLAAAFITAAVFGPYTPLPGVRTEQMAVYGSLLAGLLYWRWMRPRFTAAGLLILLLLLVETLVATVGIVLPVTNRSGFAPGNALAGLDNLLLPAAALTVGLMLVGSGADRTRLIRIVCMVLITAMCVNAVLAYVSSVRDMSWLLSPFWDHENSRPTVATLAALNSRFSGVLNQPAEGGTLYGMSVLAAIYLYRDSKLKIGISVLLLTIGGVLTVSKVFLLVGFPIAVWQAIRVSGIRLRRLLVLCALMMLVAFAAVQWGLFPSLASSVTIRQLVQPSASAGGVVDLYTAGRFGSSSTLQPVIEAVLRFSPWIGFGAGGLATPYDNGWVEALVVAGVVGAVIYTAVLVTLVVAWARRRLSVEPAESSFAGGLVLVLIGSSVGLPALTANRVATIAWLLISLLLLCPAQQHVQLVAPLRLHTPWSGIPLMRLGWARDRKGRGARR